MVRRRVCTVLIAAALVSGCSFAPPYQVPPSAMPSAFKEAGGWQLAEPADHMPRGEWWTVYRDPVLDELESKVAGANPDLAAAIARHDQAQAYLDQARAGLFPTIGAYSQFSRSRQSDDRPLRGANQPALYNSATVDVGLNYDLDLWGKVRNEVAAGKAAEQASQYDIESLQLSLQAKLAEAYFHLRGLDRQQELLADTVRTYEHALQLTESRHGGGIASDLDVSRAQTQLESARASVEDVSARRALYEHAIATIAGEAASKFSLAPAVAPTYLPSIPAGVPLALLQRRPDIAAAERHVAQANAQIGVAKAAFFPDVSLGLDGGYQSTTLSPWLAAPNEMWSIGPSLLMTLFDGGRRAAVTRQAQAKLAENGEKYKATVLLAVQQVEDQLSQLHYLGNESAKEEGALSAAQRTLELSMSRYRDGVVSYLDVVTAQAIELETQTLVLDLQTRELIASAALIDALGGGWANEPADMPTSTTTK
ncbi:NodT family efflux transporter outer membrane factor (OMF) lipoprotein [Paraburkholderia sp. RAU2J]|uniref:efflux transporter outer membrane subunit n=1 Tax=Paraburkholderia sp. RAU2J TaxID=1938810 RepID=UPI000EACCCCD|nr:efflux transporter outer membrane subunit [Paraburkholderia sp. RAU2J]RKT22108.1 NodT family efflux transporter outer membrane factor (OMF) lipoprotein [Paraburkholderia sp. RAU2J]